MHSSQNKNKRERKNQQNTHASASSYFMEDFPTPFGHEDLEHVPEDERLRPDPAPPYINQGSLRQGQAEMDDDAPHMKQGQNSLYQ